MQLNPNLLKKPSLEETLTPEQQFAAIVSGVRRTTPIPDVDGVLLGIFMQLDSNGCMGSEGKLPFHLKTSDKYREMVVANHVVVVGRKTFETTYHGKAVPKAKKTLVLAHIVPEVAPEGVVFVTHPREVIKQVKEMGEKTAWVIGGASTYEAMLNWSDIILLDHVDAVCEKPAYPYPQQKACAVYGDGMIWTGTTQTEKGKMHYIAEYHRRDAAGRECDKRCAACPFSMGCNGWEYAAMCLQGVQHSILR